jgi:hypothetical protein
MTHTCKSYTWEAEIRTVVVGGHPRQIVLRIPIFRNNYSKIDRSCGSSSKVPALQVQNPEFKPQSHQETKAHKKPFKINNKQYSEKYCLIAFVGGTGNKTVQRWGGKKWEDLRQKMQTDDCMG